MRVDNCGDAANIMSNLRILFITTDENKNLHDSSKSQGDYHENIALIGLRKLLGENCVDYPRKKILYHDFSSVPRHALHGKGFSLYHKPIEDIPDQCRNLDNQTFDVILYGTSFNYGMQDIPELEAKCKIKFYIDGNDLYGIAPNNQYIIFRNERLIGNQVIPAFKTQIIQEHPNLHPFGVALPKSRVLPIDLGRKKKLFQTTYPKEAFFEQSNERNRQHYIFDNEEAYYEDMAESWFGLTCKKGGFDAMRNCEIIAAGSVLLYRDYHLKPRYCSPVDLPTFNYSSKEELIELMNNLVINGRPSDEYIYMLHKQRQWLLNTATTEARAAYIIEVLESYVKN